MIRGEIWTVAGGVYASKPRPVVIVQDDLFDSTQSVGVGPMTGRLVDAPLLRIRIPGERDAISGRERDSDVMVDKLTAVRQSNIQTRVGRLTSEQLVEVDRSLMASLGLAR